MKRWSVVLALACTGCLLDTGCQMKLLSPAEAFGVGDQKDRTIEVSKGLFGAKAKIPLTDLKLKATKIAYNPATGGFDIQDLDVDQSWSSTMEVENRRIAENQNLFLALTTAQQDIYVRQIDAWKEMVNHSIDAAASAVAALVKLPNGGPPAADLMSGIMGQLDHAMLQRFLAALQRNGVKFAPVVPVAP